MQKEERERDRRSRGGSRQKGNSFAAIPSGSSLVLPFAASDPWVGDLVITSQQALVRTAGKGQGSNGRASHCVA